MGALFFSSGVMFGGAFAAVLLGFDGRVGLLFIPALLAGAVGVMLEHPR